MRFRPANFWGIGLLFLTPAIMADVLDYAKPKLSDYGFFEEPLSHHVPIESILPYRISTPLFTDYAFKSRFIVLPEGKKIRYINSEKFDFPVGTIFIKTFYYPFDFRTPETDWRLIETRLLVHTPEGWTGYPYVWNEDQTDAMLEIAGDRQKVSWVDERGKSQTVNYLVPNFNMCKGCHVIDNVFQPIGPKPRLLNCDNTYDGSVQNQLEKLIENEMVVNLPRVSDVAVTAEWDNNQFTLDDRARAYLDVNCTHCHNVKGPAKTSGLFLDYTEKDKTKLGLFKPPVSAGRGSGGLQYNIVPGRPDESIFIFRMESTDPGILMPESGRKMVHKEGVELIKEWIRGMGDDYK